MGAEYEIKFLGLDDFCSWTENRHHGTIAPILLIDEYDAFLKVCRKTKFLQEINNLISYNRNTQTFFSSIVCAGTFSILATLSVDTAVESYVDEMDLDDQEKRASDDSLDAFVRPFDFDSPWNKLTLIETQPFGRDQFKAFAVNVYECHNIIINIDIIEDILETTCGHPFFSIWMLEKALQLSLVRYFLEDWISSRRTTYNNELCNTPTMLGMVKRVETSKSIKRVLHILVRDNEVYFSDWEVRLVSFLRAVGIAKLSYRFIVSL